MPVSKFFRVAVEGDTTDGRKIQRNWITQMAANYSRSKYGARVWLEHIRGILPDSPFKAYGDVVELKAEEVTIDGEKKMALFAKIDATPDLVAMNKARQKVFSSIEVDPNFARSGEAYLSGLGVTDTPASLGTEMLSFAAGAQVNPLATRKQNPENLFTAAQEVEIEFEEEVTSTPGESLFTKVKELLGIKGKTDEARFNDIGQAVEAVAGSQRDLLQAFNTATADLKTAQEKIAELTVGAEKDRADFAALKQQLASEPDNTPERPASPGGSGNTVTTDC